MRRSRKMAAPSSKRRYPRGDAREMTPEWKAKVREKLEGRGAAAELARQLGVDKSLIGRMLSERQQTSKLVDRICELLQIEPPLQPVTDGDKHDELDELVEGLTEEQRHRALQILRAAF